ncbi:MAG: hypothetical protein M1816_007006 [Peltula sp. TS41687]|nr:MAG: hypothetical protein M1816_007006 [Peltula sp. TS41687]
MDTAAKPNIEGPINTTHLQQNREEQGSPYSRVDKNGGIKAISETTIPLSLLDQSVPRLYMTRFYCIPYDDTMDKNQTVSILREGLRRTIMTLPFLAASMVPIDGPKKGRVELRAGQGVQLIVKDLTNSPDIFSKSYAELDSMKMPIVLAPIETLPPPGSQAPVLAAQVNFIKGGVLLGLCPHHGVLDGTGDYTVLQLWAQYCHAYSGTENGKEKLILGPDCVDKARLLNVPSTVQTEVQPQSETADIPQLEAGEQQVSADLQHLYNPSSSPGNEAIFYFSPESLRKLKSDILSDKQVFPSPETTWLSTNDVLTALFWNCISLARHKRHASEGTTSSHPETGLVMAVNMRPRFRPALSPSLLGNVFSILRLSQPYPASRDGLLAVIASTALSIRQGLSHITEADLLSQIATLDSLPDIRAPIFDLTDAVATSSWATFSPYELDWGAAFGGNKVRYFRLPGADVMDGVVIAQPKLPDGAIEVLVRLRKDDLAVLKTFPVLGQYATVYEM